MNLSDNSIVPNSGAISMARIVVPLIIIILLILVIFLYTLPIRTANRKNHRNKEAIKILTICAGWTFIGWVVALVWAYTNTNNIPPHNGTPSTSCTSDNSSPSD